MLRYVYDPSKVVSERAFSVDIFLAVGINHCYP